MNGDGKLDLLVANSNIDTVSVWLGTGDGQFSGEIDYPTGATPFGLALGDLNNDGQPDLVTVNLSAKSVSVLLNEGAGTFGQKVDYPIGNAASVAIADLDGDGNLDVVTSNFYSASVLLGLRGRKACRQRRLQDRPVELFGPRRRERGRQAGHRAGQCLRRIERAGGQRRRDVCRRGGLRRRALSGGRHSC